MFLVGYSAFTHLRIQTDNLYDAGRPKQAMFLFVAFVLICCWFAHLDHVDDQPKKAVLPLIEFDVNYRLC